MSKPKIYIAGPMTGYKNFNRPAFFEAEAKLTDCGFDVANPARIPPPEDPTWQNYMRIAIKMMLGCDMVATLPLYKESKGACIETQLAFSLRIQAVPVDVLIKQGIKYENV